MNFLASPTIVTAMAFSGKLSFNPVTDKITTPTGEQFQFRAPTGATLPENGFEMGMFSSSCICVSLKERPIGNPAFYPSPNPKPQAETPVVISPTSSRLELLEPFSSHFPSGQAAELPPMTVLMRVRGKCTTDHISAAVCVSFYCVFSPYATILGSMAQV